MNGVHSRIEYLQHFSMPLLQSVQTLKHNQLDVVVALAVQQLCVCRGSRSESTDTNGSSSGGNGGA